MSKTDQALKLVDEGLTPYAAAKQVGITPTTVYVAMQRRKGKEKCPCCGTIVPGDQINRKVLK